MKGIFNRKTFKYAAVTTAVGFGISYVDNYIQSNSGCFVKSESSVCKVKELSWCQPKVVYNVPFCSKSQPDNVCGGFNEDQEKTCCRLCYCKYYGCLPHQTVECRRPSVGDGFANAVKSFTSTFWEVLSEMFPLLYWVLGIGAGLIILLILFQKTR
ncbi:hypothetical protein AVEN_117943-1 [Araneus ventricosus]|uniref:Uncharacterized protein n=1 Tax=Araneus ventricosus TaxID=182803 RepID=A0A4Y2KR53_ARAVE|nr:hypothetical protein AVEN_117943-1 [Araneus ventricosus]